MRMLIAILLGSTLLSASDLSFLVKDLEKEFAKKQKEYNDMSRSQRYKWEFVESWNLPWCHDELVSATRDQIVAIPGYGKVVSRSDSLAYIGVKSWIDRTDNKSQVTRVYVYRKKNGSWTHARRIDVVQDWIAGVGWVCQSAKCAQAGARDQRAGKSES